MLKRLSHYFRKDNRTTWLPMITTLILQFVSALLGHLFVSDPIAFWVLFAVSIILGVFFIAMAVKYVDKWHRHAEMLNINEGIMFKTAAFLIAMDKCKSFNRYGLTTLHTKYTLEDPITYRDALGKEKQYFPFSVHYSVTGVATQKISEFRFYLLSHPNSQKNNNMTVTGSIEGVPARISCKQGGHKHILVYSLSGQNHKKGQTIHYEIHLEFHNNAGIAAEESSRLLLYPKNFSEDIRNIPGGNTTIDVQVPRKYLEFYSEPQIRLFGENTNPNPMGRTMSFENSYIADNCAFYNHKLSSDEDTLIAIELGQKSYSI